MTGLQRNRIHRFLRESVWFPPVVAMVLVLFVEPFIARLGSVLANLIETVPPRRAALLRQELDIPDR